MGGPIKSPWEIWTRAIVGVPGPNDRLLYAPQPGIPFTTEAKATLISSLTPVLNVCSFPGATAGDKIEAAIAALPLAGGTVDARCLEGLQVIPNGSTIFSGATLTRRITLWLGDAIFSVTPQPIAIGPTIGFEILGTSTGGAGDMNNNLGTTLRWDGAIGVEFIVMDRCRECLLVGFNVKPGAASSFTVGVRMDHLIPPTTLDISFGNRLLNVGIGPATVSCVQIGNNSISNNDLHVFEYCTFLAGGVQGAFINDAQSKFIEFVNCYFQDNVSSDIHAFKGSYSAYRCNFASAHAVNNLVTDGRDVYNIVGCQSEGANKFFSTAGGSGATEGVNIIGNRVSPENGVDGFIGFTFAGSIHMIGNDFSGGTHLATYAMFFGVGVPGGATVTSRGNLYWREDIWQATMALDNRFDLVSDGDKGIAASGLSIPAVNVNGTFPGSMVLVNGANNNIAPVDPVASGFYAITGPTAAFSISGFVNVGANAAPIHGQKLVILNTTFQTMTIIDQAGSVAGNQILTLTGANVVLRVTARSCASFIYDRVLAKWILTDANGPILV